MYLTALYQWNLFVLSSWSKVIVSDLFTLSLVSDWSALLCLSFRSVLLVTYHLNFVYSLLLDMRSLVLAHWPVFPVYDLIQKRTLHWRTATATVRLVLSFEVMYCTVEKATRWRTMPCLSDGVSSTSGETLVYLVSLKSDLTTELKLVSVPLHFR